MSSFRPLLALAGLASLLLAAPEAPLRAARVTGEGWEELTLEDLVNVNGKEDTWSEADGILRCSGIEVQVLDLGYEENHRRNQGRPSDWFTSHGDVFPVGGSTMTAFTPEITYTLEDGVEARVGNPASKRSFPTRRLTLPAGEWNHYYVRAINGEVRLWVNGEEVNGGRGCSPATGYLALESEGAPVEFRNIRLRELP
jgi:hypothetical protein